MLAHNVSFSMKDASAAARDKVVADAYDLLAPLPGVLFFGCGTLSDLDRPVNDRDFDVGLHVMLESRAAHDAYQISEEHQKFIAAHKDNFAKVRVFDSDCAD